MRGPISVETIFIATRRTRPLRTSRAQSIDRALVSTPSDLHGLRPTLGHMMYRRRGQFAGGVQARYASRPAADTVDKTRGLIFRASCISDRKCSRRSSRLVWSRMKSNRSDNMRILSRSALRTSSFFEKATIRHPRQPNTMPRFTCARVRGVAHSAAASGVPEIHLVANFETRFCGEDERKWRAIARRDGRAWRRGS